MAFNQRRYHMSMSGELVTDEQRACELNFCELHKIFKEYTCHVNQIFSM
jgi:hypothetical protein